MDKLGQLEAGHHKVPLIILESIWLCAQTAYYTQLFASFNAGSLMIAVDIVSFSGFHLRKWMVIVIIAALNVLMYDECHPCSDKFLQFIL